MIKNDNTSAILDALDDERRELDEPGFRRLTTATVVYRFPLSPGQGFVSYSSHNNDQIAHMIPHVIATFDREGCDFEWKVFDHDQPSNLKSHLATAGFHIGDAEALMVLPARNAGLLLSKARKTRIERVCDAAGVADYMAVARRVWQSSDEAQLQRRMQRIINNTETMTAYVAYDGSKPVACARSTFPVGGRFAGLWSGATLDSHRGRGFYTALVAKRAQEAARRGFDYLMVDAMPTSRPILERVGFCHLSTSTPCLWTHQP